MAKEHLNPELPTNLSNLLHCNIQFSLSRLADPVCKTNDKPRVTIGNKILLAEGLVDAGLSVWFDDGPRHADAGRGGCAEQ